MARVSFTVQGLIHYGPQAGAAANEVLHALSENHFGSPAFDPGQGIFSVEIDPRVHSFADVRRALGALGKSRGLVYLAVIMSP